MTPERPLARGDHMPHVTMRTTAGQSVAYRDIWQRQHLVLVLVPSKGTAAADYAARLRAALPDAPDDVATIVTTGPVPGLRAPAALVADRWGEVVFVSEAADVAALPDPEDLAAWLRFAWMQCPECQGEAR